MDEIIVIEEENPLEMAHWQGVLPRAFPGARFHFVNNAADAIRAAPAAGAVIAKAHSVPAGMAHAAPHLRWIQALTTGVDHLLEIGVPKSVVVTNARGAHGPQMSELAFFYMLSFARDVRQVLADQEAGRWHRRGQRVLLDKNVLIVGIGAIAESLAARCAAFGMNVVGISDSRHQVPHFAEVHPRSALIGQVAKADFIVVLVPYGPGTHHMIDANVFAAMKPDAIFINIARGKVVDQDAMIAALEARRIGGAGLDVFTEEPLPQTSALWRLDNVMITPRIGGMSDSYAPQLTPLVSANIARYLAGDLDGLENRVTL